MILAVRAGIASLRRRDPVTLPEREALWVFAAIALAAWIAIAVMTGAGISINGDAARSHESMPGMGGMAGMAGMPGMSAASGGGGDPAAWLASLTAMVVAMMLPSAFPALAHTGTRSLRWRRRRAMAEFAAGYLGVWIAAGGLILAAAGWLGDGSATLCAALCVAAVWQLTPAKRRSLQACHRSVRLAPRGWQADRAALGFGARNATGCVGSCWLMMLVAGLVSASAFAWMAGITVLVTSEKLAVRPRRASRRIAAVLAVAAAAVVVL